jgi:hypothetical protein
MHTHFHLNQFDVFRAVLVDLKKKGYAGTDHRPAISHEDLRKMYRNDSLVINTTTPYFEIPFHMFVKEAFCM